MHYARNAMTACSPSALLLEEQAVLEALEADYPSGKMSSARKRAFAVAQPVA